MFLCALKIGIIVSIVSTIYCQENNKFKNTPRQNEDALNEPPTFLFVKVNSNDREEENLTRVYFDDNVAGYASHTMDPIRILWPFKFASKAWEYAKKTYGPYGHDPRIYIILYHKNKNDTSADVVWMGSYSTHLDDDYNFKNIVKLGRQSAIDWVQEVDKTVELRYLTEFIGEIVEFSSKNTKGSPGYNNDDLRDGRSFAWNFVFVYDVFSKLGMSEEAALFLLTIPGPPLTEDNEKSNEDSLDEIDSLNWVKNWFWPIYLKYGGPQAFNQFFEYCYSYFPRKLKTRSYSQNTSYFEYVEEDSTFDFVWMNKGKFVHFWSGSAGIDLRNLADFAFTWDAMDEENFQMARVMYPNLTYRCNNSCGKIQGLEHVITDFRNNVPTHSASDIQRPMVKVFSERRTHPIEIIRKKVKRAYLYRPLNQSERYLYDGENELHILETKTTVCYYFTCSAPYLVKWVTNIPLKKTPLSAQLAHLLGGCKGGTFLISRRLQDTVLHTETPLGEKHEGQSPLYTIQFIFSNDQYNMGLLKCESIENSTLSTHFYLTDYYDWDYEDEWSEVPRSLVQYYDASEYTCNKASTGAELFVDNTLDRKLIVPCRGTHLRVKQNLRWSHQLSRGEIWDMDDLAIKTDKHNITFDPVIGFTMTYESSPFKFWPDGDGHSLTFYCRAEDASSMKYKLFVTSKENGHTSKITTVDDKSEIAADSRGCFLVKNSDTFIFVGNSNVFPKQVNQYSLKLISCNSPNDCYVLRQCLDFEGNFCYSDQAQIQADSFQLLKPHNRGLLRCFDYKVENKSIGDKPTYEYTFLGLDRIRYILSENIPTKAIIAVDEVSPVLFTNVPATFRCQIATFILVANMRFALIFENRTIQLQNLDKHKPRESTLPFLSSKMDLYPTNDVSSVINANADLGIGWENINLNLTADVVGVMCFAPLLNSSKWVNASRSFKAKDIQKPSIKKDGQNSRRVFGKGEKDLNLHCESSGIPDPEIKWMPVHVNPVLEESLLARPSEIPGESGNSFLKFPPMEESFAGTYTCIVSNLYGNDSYDFLLEYQESGLGWRESVGIGFSVIFILSMLTSFAVLLLKYRNTSRKLRDLTEKEIQEFMHGKENKVKTRRQIDISLLPFDKKFILDPRDLMIENGVILGKGNFGIVYRGLLNGCPVAVKTLKSTAEVSHVKSLLGELKIMSFIGDHAHIVHFFGAVIEKIQKRAVEAVVELSPFGNLQNHLRHVLNSMSTAGSSKFIDILVNDVIVLGATTTLAVQATKDAITTLNLVDWCQQIASGMNFLASKKVYHGDLATRNVLVFGNNSLKITDFGMSKQLYVSTSYVKKEKIALPWRWMALETLNFQEFSIESDVWAFGVTVWEIFSLGKLPFPGLHWTPEFVTILSTGMRMAKPEYCSRSVYDQMLRCWREMPVDRPTFTELLEFFQRILDDHQKLSATSQNVDDQSFGNNEITYSLLDQGPVIATH